MYGILGCKSVRVCMCLYFMCIYVERGRPKITTNLILRYFEASDTATVLGICGHNAGNR